MENKIPKYIDTNQLQNYNMWTIAQPDKSKKGDKYQSNITLTEETLKRQMALEYKLGLNRHKTSQIPEIALNVLYDIAFILEQEKLNILDMSTEEIINHVGRILNNK